MSIVTTPAAASTTTAAEASQAVVLHDTHNISPEMAVALTNANREVNEAIFKLETLESSREHWENTELAASHQRLYSILTEGYAYYLTMKTHSNKIIRDQYARALDTFIKVRNYGGLNTTHDMNKVIKSVFGVDRRRVSAYSLALRAALLAGGKDQSGKTIPLPAASLASWIENNGGVEEIRLGSKNNGKKASERAAIAKTAIYETSLMAIKPDAKVTAFSTNDADKMVVLIATYRPTGELEVNAVVKSDSVVTAALAAHFNANKDTIEKDAEKAQAIPATPSAITQALTN